MVQRLTRRWCLAFANETGLHPNHQHLHHRRRPAAALRSTSIAAWSQGKSPPPFLDFHSTSFKTKINFGCGGKKTKHNGWYLFRPAFEMQSQPKLFGFREKKKRLEEQINHSSVSLVLHVIFGFLTQK